MQAERQTDRRTGKNIYQYCAVQLLFRQVGRFTDRQEERQTSRKSGKKEGRQTYRQMYKYKYIIQ
jgi:hypothetical protein